MHEDDCLRVQCGEMGFREEKKDTNIVVKREVISAILRQQCVVSVKKSRVLVDRVHWHSSDD